VKLLVLALTALALAGCASTRPASVAGECGVFRNPGFAVQGKRRQDQQAIDGKWIEPGIASCGWARPAN
jgi:hypothetical protein